MEVAGEILSTCNDANPVKTFLDMESKWRETSTLFLTVTEGGDDGLDFLGAENPTAAIKDSLWPSVWRALS